MISRNDSSIFPLEIGKFMNSVGYFDWFIFPFPFLPRLIVKFLQIYEMSIFCVCVFCWYFFFLSIKCFCFLHHRSSSLLKMCLLLSKNLRWNSCFDVLISLIYSNTSMFNVYSGRIKSIALQQWLNSIKFFLDLFLFCWVKCMWIYTLKAICARATFSTEFVI